jgi:hypothetical protein
MIGIAKLPAQSVQVECKAFTERDKFVRAFHLVDTRATAHRGSEQARVSEHRTRRTPGNMEFLQSSPAIMRSKMQLDLC